MWAAVSAVWSQTEIDPTTCTRFFPGYHLVLTCTHVPRREPQTPEDWFDARVHFEGFQREYVWPLQACRQVCVNISDPRSVLMAGQWLIAMAMVNRARMVMYAGELFQEKHSDAYLKFSLPLLWLLRSVLWWDPRVTVSPCFLHLLWRTLAWQPVHNLTGPGLILTRSWFTVSPTLN